MKKIRKAVFFIVVTTLVIIGLVIIFRPKSLTYMSKEANLISIRSKSDLVEVYNRYYPKETLFEKIFGQDRVSDFDVVEENESADLATDDGSDTSEMGEYSQTNTQVSGVDEMDNAKTDGDTIYSISKKRVVITDVATMEVRDKIIYEDSFYPNGLYVDSEYLIVIGTSSDFDIREYTEKDGEPDIDYWDDCLDCRYYNQNANRVYVYYKNSLEPVTSYKIEGHLIGTRKILDNLFLMVNNHVSGEGLGSSDEVLPKYQVGLLDVSSVDYSDIVYKEGSAPNNFISVFGIDIKGSTVSNTTFLGNGYEIYMSKSNLYLTSTIYNYANSQDGVGFVQSTDDVVDESNDVDTVTTKSVTVTDKATLDLISENAMYKTGIVKFGIDESKVSFSDYAEVGGRVNNQFSMDEFDGYFRIATTDGNTWGVGSTNNALYVLDSEFDVISSVQNLALGETIQSARFALDKVYIVTFRQVDPLFVIDAGDPFSPLVLGELKITGFSTYMHLFDENHIIGFGFEATDDGVVSGLKISLFNVSDPSVPLELYKTVIDYEESGWGYSSATYNHKDLLFSKSKGIIGFPFESNVYSDGKYEFMQGYKLFGIDLSNGFTDLGFQTHYDGNESAEVGSGFDKEHDYEREYMSYLYHQIYKGMFIGDKLYTISENYIKETNLYDIENIIKSTDLN